MARTNKIISRLLTLLIVLAAWGCGTDESSDAPERATNEWGKATFDATDDEEIAPTEKNDAITGQRGLPVSVDTSSTAVWTVSNAWEDTDTPAARKAGMAWGENSGLTWEEKYHRWVQSFEHTENESGWGETFLMTTPWGKTLPAPALECAEVAIFLRITFASWYNLPFFLEARDADGRLYFGHFGMRRADGKFGRMPNFKTRYPDFSSQASDVLAGGEWPSDEELAGKKIPGSFDDAQPMLGPDAHAGAYFDEIYLNKRVGHFMILTLAWFGSVNLADPSNTFNLKPEAVVGGDVLVKRWQKTGIGHVFVVMRGEKVGEKVEEDVVIPQLEVEVASGSMPRRQPVWENPGASKRYFSNSSTGGPDTVQFGGGLKRWRIAKNIGGRWTNVVPASSTQAWIDSTDHETLAGRLDRFEEILVELSPDQKRDVLLDVIESKRQHLRRFPASCSARIAREEAFDDLYLLMETEFGMRASEVDSEYRLLEDYVFAELEYEKSKTCCWNSSTSDMHEIIMDLNLNEQQAADQCVAPIVFMNRDDDADGYDLFRQHAAELGREDQWVAWSADESCPQANVAVDTPVDPEYTPYCELAGEPMEPTGEVRSVKTSFGSGIDIPDNDDTGLVLTTEIAEDSTVDQASVALNITHTWRGDLEVILVHPDGTEATLHSREGSSEDNLRGVFTTPLFEGKNSAGTWTLIVRDRAAMDTGTVESADLEVTLQN